MVVGSFLTNAAQYALCANWRYVKFSRRTSLSFVVVASRAFFFHVFFFFFFLRCHGAWQASRISFMILFYSRTNLLRFIVFVLGTTLSCDARADAHVPSISLPPRVAGTITAVLCALRVTCTIIAVLYALLQPSLNQGCLRIDSAPASACSAAEAVDCHRVSCAAFARICTP